MSSRDEAPREMPKALVEDFLEQEAGTRAFLDELQKLAAEGRHDEVRDRLRDFAEHSQGAFFTVALSLGGTAQTQRDGEEGALGVFCEITQPVAHLVVSPLGREFL